MKPDATVVHTGARCPPLVTPGKAVRPSGAASQCARPFRWPAAHTGSPMAADRDRILPLAMVEPGSRRRQGLR